MFSFLFSSLPPIKVFTDSKKAIVANFSSLARHEPGDQRRVALKWKSEPQNPAGSPPQTELDPVPGGCKQLHIYMQPSSLTSKKLSRIYYIRKWAESSIPLRLRWWEKMRSKGDSSYYLNWELTNRGSQRLTLLSLHHV